jgi:four helix bundle protein
MIERKNPAKEKSFEFAVKLLKVIKEIRANHKEYTLTEQLLRSGTSIGANIEEATGAFSEKDFHFKFSISYKEARETHYWIRLLNSANYLDEKTSNELLLDVEELQKIIGSIIKTLKNKKKEK